MTTSLPSVTIVRRIKAPPAKVYAALTDPEQMVLWWGPDAGPTLSAEADVRPGRPSERRLPLAERRRAQSTGVYREVVPDEKLVFTWE